MTWMLKLVPVFAAAALLFAVYLAMKVSRQEAGTRRMKEISDAIADGARAFLMAEYRILVVFVVVLFVLIGVGTRSLVTAVCLWQALYFPPWQVFWNAGGDQGQRAYSQCGDEIRHEPGPFHCLFRRCVMGLCVAGLGVLGVSLIYLITGDIDVLSGFSFGASSIALFARVGGGIYTKAADVGADLVGKVEAGIPEDDPRNPAVIADNVGDNVGDVSGMGADLFESYVGALISALTLGIVYHKTAGIAYPLVISGLGLLASMFATFFVKGDEKSDPHKALKMAPMCPVRWLSSCLLYSV